MAGHSAAECLREPLASELPTRCQQLKKGYGDCKRGMIDMRKRFRGNKPISSTATTGSDGDEGRYIGGVGEGMLYAGIGKKEAPVQRDIGWGAGEDEARGRDELVPGRFKEESGGAGVYYQGYTPPPENAVKSELKSQVVEREGAGWSWWRGS
jgi:hypothetical protein